MKNSLLRAVALSALLLAPAAACLAQAADSVAGVDPASTLTTPSDVKATAVSSTQVTLEWTIPREGSVKGYSIDRCEGEADRCMFFKPVGTTQEKKFTNSDLTPGSTYNYRVAADLGTGRIMSYSKVISVTVPESDEVPAASEAKN